MRIIVLCLMMLINSAAFSAVFSSSAGAAQTYRTIKAVLNKEFFLKIGQAAVIRNEDLQITFEAVLEDSRCPQDVDCIQAGKGRIKIRVIKTGSAEQSFELETTVNTSTAIYESYEIKLLELQPYPKSTREIKKDQYRAGLIVTKK